MIWFYIIPMTIAFIIIPVFCYRNKEVTVLNILGITCAVIPIVNITVAIWSIMEVCYEFAGKSIISWD